VKIAVGGFQHETNSFAPTLTTYDNFTQAGGWPGLTRGEAMFDAVAGINLALTGFIAEASAARHALVPLLWANAVPGGLVEAAAFERIAAMLITDLAEMGPFDAVYLDLHGAMVTTAHEDGEGELLRRVRAVAGPDTLIVASLDWHANVTEAMIEHADYLTGYRTYPHIDLAETGRRAARWLNLGRRRVAKRLIRVPFLIPLTAQCSLAEPCLSLFRQLAAIEASTGADLTFAPGFPPADIGVSAPTVFGYGPGGGVTDDAVASFAALVMAAESAFAREAILAPADAVSKALELGRNASRPVVLADTQDNPGAGASSDTTGMLSAVVAAGVEGAAIALMHDPQAAQAAHRAGVGAMLTLALGGRSGVAGDAPFDGVFRVAALGDGNFAGSGPMWQGAELSLGLMARLEIGGVSVLVSSQRQQPSTQAIFRHLGLEPSALKILVLKSSVHFRADFQDLAEAVLVVAAPGVNLADPAAFPYRHLAPGIRLRPLGPAFAGSRPSV
jgi:microcystin degradation protein MlrC